ncbi:MAG: Eco57I restriction-modification methylase domain-containing protein [Myxococcota bacterium]
MDRETRNRIQRATQDARALLEREYAEQLEGTFDIRLDGTVAGSPGEHLDARQRLLRAKLVAAVEHLRAGGRSKKDAVAAYLREAAFTTLNRFVALKMLEARGLVQECLSRGEESSGFKNEFSGLAPGLVQLPDHGYRLYIESLFDEIAREVRVLFDRRDPASLLWPRRQALLDLLAILNAAELSAVWGEDETIGWVYQYFNSDEDRQRARYDEKGKPKAPRSSYELAVRNQFFTPRYVVEFLTDNTLGRIWYEMRQGNTRLRDLDYLVRRPNEVFLAEGEEAPADTNEALTQDELLQHPVYVPFRAKKDPRDIRVLDPACGSGHFLLYAFDLLLVIYEEAWADETAPTSEVTGTTLCEDYAEIESLRAAAPGLILRHNLHGIDIDARCAQIAALALWMRAQRAYKDAEIGRDVRPPIQKTKIVVAEPMPGEPELRREFIATLDSKLGQLIERVFDRMELAGEAGSLLRIEDDIRDAVRETYGEHGQLFHASDEERWRQAEQEVLRALRAYAERAANGRAFQRRLFAEDAARGLGFVDLCGHNYDVVLMNPPFGAFSERVRSWAASAWPRTKNDIYAAFVERGIGLLHTRGRLGAITSRTGFFLSSFQMWREDILLKEAPPVVVADLGHGVMDDAMVEAAAYCLEVAA